MIQKVKNLLAIAFLPLLLCQCVTTEQATVKSPPITVQGTLFYPDEANQTYIVPAGAEIVGAGGNNCRYIVENGGKLTAHSGTDNTYKIKQGGFFKGFAHPANNCRVQYQNGAQIEKVQGGSEVAFELTH
ncbi:MAG: hypothetical protein P1U89_26680 [Verrucomicrobiales bacterium]|nr:hypothetical protein [Verrucomicrobiales bacterium]